MLTITQGDYKAFGVQLPRTPDITGCTVFFTVKNEADIETVNATDSNAVIKDDESLHAHPAADPEVGKTVIELTPEQTTVPIGEYVYDIQLVDSAGHPHTYKKANGDLLRCKVTPQSTQRTA